MTTLIAVVWGAVLLLNVVRSMLAGHLLQPLDVFLPLSILASTYAIARAMPPERRTTSTHAMLVMILVIGAMTLLLRVWQWMDT